jgi:ADP-glucose pyrophosphorylase
VPAQHASARTGSPGSADAIYQSLNLLSTSGRTRHRLRRDHIYRMDPCQMVESTSTRRGGDGRRDPPAISLADQSV